MEAHIETALAVFLDNLPPAVDPLTDNLKSISGFLGTDVGEARRIVEDLEKRGIVRRWGVVRDQRDVRPTDPIQPPSRWKKVGPS